MTDAEKKALLAKIHGLLALVEAGEDYDAALAEAVVFTRSPDLSLRMNGLHCLGDVARVYSKLDLDVTLPLVREGEKDSVPVVAAAARDVLDDLEVFLPGFDRLRAGQGAEQAPHAA